MKDLPQLNPNLVADHLAEGFRLRGRVHIPSILTAQSAARVQRCLEQETKYQLSVSTPTEHHDLDYDFIASRGEAWRAKMLETVYLSASNPVAEQGFQAFYDNHRMSNDGEAYRDPEHYLGAIVAFLNSETFLDFMRRVTGFADIAYADAQATRFVRNQFLTLHNDRAETRGQNRRAAYVLNMTEQWRADWGGLLLFLDDDRHVSSGFTPAFNALNLLAVPQLHLVSQVSPFAQKARYSVTGWLCARE